MPSAIAHVSRFIGHAIPLLYLVCAGITVFEVFTRYVLASPTQWAFEVVMTLCALAWVLSAGYVTLYRRHIAITVITDMAGADTRRALSLVSTVVSVVAIYLLLEASLMPMLKSVDLVQRTGSGFNSPMPMLLKIGLVVGTVLYVAQLFGNLFEDVSSRVWRVVIAAVGVVLLLRILALLADHYFGSSGLTDIFWAMFSPLEPLGSLGRELDIRSVPLSWVTVFIVLALLALMMTGMPLGVATLAVSIFCALLFFGPRGLFLVTSNVTGLLEHYTLVAVPLFVLMSCILERSGVAKDLFDAMSIFAGNLRGGVAVQTTVVAVVLAAMTGIMGGEIVMLGLVALPQMLRLGYNRKLAMGVICAAGSLATLIPPSIIMIVYGLAAQVGIGDLFMAGAVPGMLYATLYIVYILVICRLRPEMAPTSSEIAERAGEEQTLARHRLIAVLMALLVIAMVMGSIYAGIASVTEAAGVGVIGSCIVAAIRMELSWKMLLDALLRTSSTVGTIIWLVLGAVSLVGIYNVIGGARFMRELFTGLDMHPMLIILLMMAVLMVLRTFMEWIAIVFITVPIFAPVVMDL
ncbi:TRAP transporter large permease subunit, partial [Rhodobacteraceae bacterium R_SAG2]|nr:TRAP transporter large permease subunit [Rhodobacteraceae bacterium R_SAG2]